ncbi:MAG: phosphate acyltransferase PlsX [Clostridiales bacterium]|nr:phosphate acyltransferase PlsX [Clostridiales bacterium]
MQNSSDKHARIIIDAMGGDNAPNEIVKGAVLAAKEFPIDIILVGKEEAIRDILKKEGEDDLKFQIVHAAEEVLMEDNPSTVLRDKKDTSMGVALKLLGEGGGDALVSAGSTGALLTGGTLFVKRIKGIRRAALAPILPTKNGGALLIDCGANVECTPEYLLQFAYMGYFYAKSHMNIKNPKVGLINIGTEETKGTPLYKETYALLKKAADTGTINFIGNIEGRDIVEGKADVILCDGFTGNIILKTIEGVGLFFVGEMKKIFKQSLKTKIAALMVKSGLVDFKKMLDYKEVGGAPLLGISKPIIKAHGSSDAHSFKSAIKQAVLYANLDIIPNITNNLCHMTINEE